MGALALFGGIFFLLYFRLRDKRKIVRSYFIHTQQLRDEIPLTGIRELQDISIGERLGGGNFGTIVNPII